MRERERDLKRVPRARGENALYMRSKRARDASTREHVGQWLSPHSRQVSSRTTNFSPVVRRSVVGRRRRRTWPRIKLHLDSCIDFSFFNARLVFLSSSPSSFCSSFVPLRPSSFSLIVPPPLPSPPLSTHCTSREDPVSRRNETGSAREEAKDRGADSVAISRGGRIFVSGRTGRIEAITTSPWRERSSSRR